MDYDEGIVSETGNWNVAFDYVKYKIMRPFYFSDEYSKVAKFGYTSLFEELSVGQNMPPDLLRLKGFSWWVNELLILLRNSIFAIKKESDRNLLIEYKNKLKEIEDIIPILSKKIINQVSQTTEIKIIEDKYKQCYDEVYKIQEGINTPLNNNHLIFTQVEGFDPDEFKEKIKNKLIEEG